MLADGLRALLNADSGLAGLLTGGLHPVQGRPDQPVYPYCTYRSITAGHESTLDLHESGHKLIQFDVFGEAYGDGAAILQALRNVLAGYIGTLSEGTRVLETERGNEQDNFDFDQRKYHSFVEYEFEYVEP